MKQIFKTSGICARTIEFELSDDNRIENVRFVGGCAGNALGISRLVEGMRAEDAIKKLQGVKCQNGTSCPDQFAKALIQALSDKSEI